MNDSKNNYKTLKAELDSLLKNPPSPKHDAKAHAKIFAEPFRPVLFGAGQLGRVTLNGLLQSGVKPLAFVDNNPRHWESTIDGLPVLSLAAATEKFGANVPIVVTIYTNAELDARLRELGLNVITFPELALRYPKTLLPWAALELPSEMTKHAKEIREAFELWNDDISREEYVAQIRFRYSFQGPLPPSLPTQATYYPSELVSLKKDEVFVDCGAFDGDSITAFMRRTGGWLGGVVGIEADPQNAKKLNQLISTWPAPIRSKIEVVQAAVGSENKTLRFNSMGTAASNYLDGQGTIEVQCRKLDDILANKKPSYIKMDIEGAEPDAVAGAEQIIKKHHPVMAICLYHRQSDLWSIVLQIRKMTDGYKFFLRRYSDDCWEQVLYAIPHDRVKKA